MTERLTGMGGHQSARMDKDEWLTPPHVIKALGSFDLDPCAPIVRPWDTAAQHYSVRDDGLSKPWSGRVWLNPPYGAEAKRWLQRMASHGRGIALTFARTETAMFFDQVWREPAATAVLFHEGRFHFHHVDGSRAAANSGAPSVFIAYGIDDADILRRSTLKGAFVDLGSVRAARRPSFI